MRSAHPRSKVFDPMAGSGSTLVACMERGLIPFGIELDQTYHARGLQRMVDTWSGMTAGHKEVFMQGNGK